MSQLFAKRSTPNSVEDLRSSNISIAVNEHGAKESRYSDYFLGVCRIYVDAHNEVAMKKVGIIAELQNTKDGLATFFCKSSSTDALCHLQTIGVSVNFD